jgi:hypothetical protein
VLSTAQNKAVDAAYGRMKPSTPLIDVKALILLSLIGLDCPELLPSFYGNKSSLRRPITTIEETLNGISRLRK